MTASPKAAARPAPAAQPVSPAPAAPAALQPPPPSAAPVTQAPPVMQAPPPPAPVAPAATAAAPAPTKAAAAKGPLSVQIAATRSEASAHQEWLRLQRAHPDLLGGLELSVSSTDIPGKGTFYRLRAGPLATRAAALKLCQSLKAVSIGCNLVKP
jgi:cell division septation protein DedD